MTTKQFDVYFHEKLNFVKNFMIGRFESDLSPEQRPGFDRKGVNQWTAPSSPRTPELDKPRIKCLVNYSKLQFTSAIFEELTILDKVAYGLSRVLEY